MMARWHPHLEPVSGQLALPSVSVAYSAYIASQLLLTALERGTGIY